ncbi:MAG TPA: bifunctional diaminohydroxyphosphoribosylaminopyrimidine deaminase/5-amino-6-(5-phosphoribosylamino)uracil reductase RibD [Bacteroidales bacterium]|nr:bifunctional diaminohydroxyphosphoribosylaminopyrimidine deaminase/5-amino-6-(5-phosphoribosylamino)uracil reductase RibD [Bacteroidales bacterium]
MTELEDKKYMHICLDIAQQAFGNTYPNPMVGCVIVHNSTIIGQGYHKKAGEPHAEVLAIESVQNKDLLKKSILYVNLEPCAHYGKTPPCSLAIIQHGIPRVVIGCIDTYSEVAGKGIDMLRNAGIDVTVGILEHESRICNSRFFTFHEQKRPYIILKWAQTQDGFIDIAPEYKTKQKGLWITDDICKKLVHTWRTQEQGILIGTNTAEIDNPQLTARLAQGNNPLRLVIDLHNRLPQHLHVKDGSTPTIIFTGDTKTVSKQNVEYLHIDTSKPLWGQICKDLYTRNIQSVIIEGGAQILEDCIRQNIWDEMRVFIGPLLFSKGVEAPKHSQKPEITQHIGNSILHIYYNDNSMYF